MNTLILRTRYLVGSALLSAGMALLIFSLPGSRGQELRQQDQTECRPWQYRDDNGNCVDRPHVIHFPGEHHAPAGSEECWVECLCQVGTYPAAESCAPCSFVGTVCIRH